MNLTFAITICLLNLIPLMFLALNSTTEKEIGGETDVPIVSGEGFFAYLSVEAHFHKLLNFILLCDFLREVFRPRLRRILEHLAIEFVHSRDLRVLRVVRLRRTEQCLQWNQRRADRQSRRPFVFKDVETDRAGLRADVRVPDLCHKLHLLVCK